MLNAYDDSVSGVCCSTAVPARGGDILTRSGVRLGIICTYIIYLFTIYYTYVHIYTSKIYIYIKKKKKKNTLFHVLFTRVNWYFSHRCFVNKSIDKLLSLLFFSFSLFPFSIILCIDILLCHCQKIMCRRIKPLSVPRRIVSIPIYNRCRWANKGFQFKFRPTNDRR